MFCRKKAQKTQKIKCDCLIAISSFAPFVPFRGKKAFDCRFGPGGVVLLRDICGDVVGGSSSLRERKRGLFDQSEEL
jgi:hypothetical protein